MKEITLQATKRDVLGKRNRFLRRQGQTPVHLFGHNLESLALQCDTAELKKIVDHAGTTRILSLKVKGVKEPKSVFIREIQKDALGKQLIHVDFYQVRSDETMTMNVPIVIEGESPALKSKGRILAHGVSELSVECLPQNVPAQIIVDISVLEDIDHAIFVKDIKLGPGVVVHTDPEQFIVKVTEVYVKSETEGEGEEEAAAAEGPTAGEKEEA